MRPSALAVFLLSFVLPSLAQQASVRIEVTGDGMPAAGAMVVVNGQPYVAGRDGVVSAPVEPGQVEITASSEGYAPAVTTLTVKIGQQQKVVLSLERHEEEIIVSATRTEARLEEQPTRIEVLGRDEIEEKMLMTPGDIVMMLNEMGGLRVQATSPSLGAASIRIQGMRGRYTRFLSDGLPLFGQQVGGLGLLQIPPMDLAQVEVIKGVASSLYGAGAMGGVVNLVSRRPEKERSREFLLNQTTRGGTDAVFYMTSPLRENWGMSLLGGGHYQRQTDVDEDGWADLAGYRRAVVRPRFFWDGKNGRTLFLTAGGTLERREGGTMADKALAATGEPYHEALATGNLDMGAVGQFVVAGKYLFSARFAVARRGHNHRFGEVEERDVHQTLFSELTARRGLGAHTLVLGVALEREAYRPSDVPQFHFAHVVPGVFAQDDVVLSDWVSASVSARLDHHNVYGAFFSPRLSAFFHKSGWSSRISIGQGFFAPTPLTEETEAAGLSRLQIPRPLRAERGRSASLDVTRIQGTASFTLTLFGSRISNPLRVERSATYELTNLSDATTNAGLELLATFRPKPFSLTATYTFVSSRETEGSRRVETALTPRHSAGAVGMWEVEKKSRIGMEIYYTGKQRLEANPFRETSRPYIIVGALAEHRFGPARVFVNAENLLGVRQTRWDPLLRPNRTPDGRWTVDAWAPLDGRVINGGVRFEF